jgi:hypothetical protein
MFAVLEEVGVPELPVAIPQVSLITLWRREAEDEGVSFIQQMRLVDPDGNEVLHSEQEFRMLKPRHRSLGMVEFVPFEKAGCYRFEILLRRADEGAGALALKASYPLDVSVVSREQSDLLRPPQES